MFENSFHSLHAEESPLPLPVSDSQHFVVGVAIVHDLIRNRIDARKRRSDMNRQRQIRDRTRRPTVSPKERVDPVHPPHQIRAEVDGRRSAPLVVDVAAHVFDIPPHIFVRRRFVFGEVDLHITIAKLAGARVEAVDGKPVEVSDEPRRQLEAASGCNRAADDAIEIVELPKVVAVLEVALLRASPIARGRSAGARCQRYLSFVFASFSAASSTDSRVMAPFSMAPFP